VGNAGRSGPERLAATAAVLTDEHGVVTSWGPEAEALTGHLAAEMVGQPAWEICGRMAPPGLDPELIRRRVKAAIEAFLASGRLPRRPLRRTLRFRRRDGSVGTVEHDLAAVPAGGGYGLAAFVTEVGGGGDRPARNLHGLLFENMSTAVAVAETIRDATGKPLDYRIVDANPAFERLVGRPTGDVIGRRLFEIRTHVDPRLVEGLAEVAATGRSLELDLGGLDADLAVLIRLSRVGDWIVAMIDDVTEARRAEARELSEHRRAEAATELQTRFLQQLVDAIPIPIVAKDRQGRVQLANKAFGESAGLSPEQAIGQLSADLPGFDPDLQTGMDEFVVETGQVQVYEGRMPRPDGTEAHAILTNAPLRDDSGAVTGVVSAVVDMTERFVAEQALRQSEERFHTLFEHASDAIFMADLEGRFFEANRKAAESLGYTRAELLGMTVDDISPVDDSSRMADVIARLKEHGSLSYETRHRRRDGTLIPVELNTTIIDLSGRPAILGIARDISQRQRAEADRAALEDQLRQSQKMEGIGRLAGGIAHDFNNLLTAIRGYATLALSTVGLDDEVRDDLEQIEQAADRAAGLTKQLLAFARKTVLQPEKVDLAEIVHGVEPMLTRLLGEDITLVTVTPPSRGLVTADPSQMEQVILNLAINARDAMPDGGRLTIETADVELDEESVKQLPAATVGPNALLAVTDTGTGMDEATMAHLFEPFFTTKGPGKGTGLGLATVYGIVGASGGAITATSELGRGSTFKVFLPRVEAAGASVVAEPPATVGAPPERQATTILVVEDDNGVRGFVTRVLQRSGYRVLAASGGNEAFELADGQKLGLMVTDVVMPLMSGKDVAERLTATHPGLRVLYVSGHAEHAIVKHGVLEPGIDFLAKPFTAEALLAAVDRAVREVAG